MELTACTVYQHKALAVKSMCMELSLIASVAFLYKVAPLTDDSRVNQVPAEGQKRCCESCGVMLCLLLNCLSLPNGQEHLEGYGS